jgi:hypothetical protein
LIVGNYPSQFFLASAANKFLQSYKPVIVERIKKLTKILRLGLDSKQVAREIASKTILLRAMHKAVPYSREGQNEITCGRPVRLLAFLKALTGMNEDSLDLGPNISEEHRIRPQL